MKILFIALTTLVLLSGKAEAQFAATKEAQYLAVIKAVADYKIDDEEQLKNVESLRENANFNRKLQKMLDKLSNSRSKNADNRRVLQILERAGKEIYDLLK